jgi:hypothetical protein
MSGHSRQAPSYPGWFDEILADRAIRKPSPHTAKAYRQDFEAIATLVAGGLSHAKTSPSPPPEDCPTIDLLDACDPGYSIAAKSIESLTCLSPNTVRFTLRVGERRANAGSRSRRFVRRGSRWPCGQCHLCDPN